MPLPDTHPADLQVAVARVIRGGGMLPTAKAREVLDAIPDGWAKWNGRWVEIERDFTSGGRFQTNEPLEG